MKRIFVVLCILCHFIAQAQIPAGYYSSASGQTGEALYRALSLKIRPHTVLSYTPGVWDAIGTTDRKPSGKVWDIYSDVPGGSPAYEYTYITDQCGSVSHSSENGCYNREHTWPQSKFVMGNPLDTPVKTDVFLVYPTDYFVNFSRGDNPYGKVGSASTTFTNGSKLGNNTYPGAPSGTCFEPIDSFKGDIARTLFYVSTCYRNDSAKFLAWEMATQVRLKPWAAQMLIEWHRLDPVSKKELDRNNAIYALQGNRNPFIDHPEYAECIWGSTNCATSGITDIGTIERYNIFPNPSKGFVIISWQDGNLRPISISVYEVSGRLLLNELSHKSSNNEVVISTEKLPKGLYLLSIQTTIGVEQRKLVVE